MAVWIIQLKDNRNKGENKHKRDKFDFCYKNKIVGIGWCDEKYNVKGVYPDCDRARKYFNEIQIGDLIWTKIPNEKVYHLYKVASNELDDNIDEVQFQNMDINTSYCKKVKFLCSFTSSQLPVNYKCLISRSTIRPVKKQYVIDETEKLGNRGSV